MAHDGHGEDAEYRSPYILGEPYQPGPAYAEYPGQGKRKKGRSDPGFCNAARVCAEAIPVVLALAIITFGWVSFNFYVGRMWECAYH